MKDIIPMRKKNRQKKLQSGLIATLIALSAWIVLPGCSDESAIRPDVVEGKSKEVTFNVTIPAVATPSTRAMGAKEEEVQELDILVFKQSGGVYLLEEHKEVKPSSIEQTGNTVNFRAQLSPGNSKNIVVLANSRAAIGTLTNGTSKAAILTSMMASQTGKWPTNGATQSGYTPFPMAGELASANVVIGNTINGISLTRMLARIDVKVSTTNFTLNKIHLCNHNQAGQITPALLTTGLFAPTSTVNLPLNPNKNTGTPLTYIPATPLTNGAEYTEEIYTFESEAASDDFGITDDARKQATCLVVEGDYNGTTYFYRIDFTKEESTGTAPATIPYMSLLRNHKYIVNITKAEGIGYSTLAEALESYTVPSNLKTRLMYYDEGKVKDIVYNGQYMLGVSNITPELTSDEHKSTTNNGNDFTIMTDNPDGWIVENITDTSGSPVSWLDLTTRSGSSGTGNTKFILSENTTQEYRTAYIHLKAGRLRQIVEVTQTDIAAVDVLVQTIENKNITEIEFASGIAVQPMHQQIKVRWAPKGGTVDINNVPTENYPGFIFSSSNDMIPSGHSTLTNSSGEYVYTIRPTIITPAELIQNPFHERSSDIEFSIADNGKVVNKKLTVKQKVYNLKTDLNTIYRPDGKQYSFKIKSNMNWRIKSVTESVIQGTGSLLNISGTDNLKVGQTGGPDTIIGDILKFTTINNMTYLFGTVKVVFESPTSLFNDIAVEFSVRGEYFPTPHQGWAGSNIYWDGTKLTFDDVNDHSHKTYQGILFKWGSLWGVDPSGPESGWGDTSSNWSTSSIVYKSGNNDYTSNINWNDIPYISTNKITTYTAGKDEKDRHFLIEMHDPGKGFGDICKYLTEKNWAPGAASGKKWRMPTTRELGSSSNYMRSGTFQNHVSDNKEGKYTPYYPIGGYTKSGQGSPFFPTSGYRSFNNGTLRDVGSIGIYWSGSPSSTDNAGSLFFFMSSLETITSLEQNYAVSVRCVQE